MTAPYRQQYDPTDSFLRPGAALVLTDTGSVQEGACIPGVPCVTLQDDTTRPIRKEPQIHSPLVELSACCARGSAGNADECRFIISTHRKGREERKEEELKSLRPLRSLRLMDIHGFPMAQGNKVIGVFQTGFTGSTGCIILMSFMEANS